MKNAMLINYYFSIIPGRSLQISTSVKLYLVRIFVKRGQATQHIK